MFTGITEELGEVVTAETYGDTYGDAARLRVWAPTVTAGTAVGDSVAVCGVCLTVTGTAAGTADGSADGADGSADGSADGTADAGTFAVDVTRETLARSRLGALRAGSPVNLERPLTPTSRLGGHLLQGHVDGTGEIVERTPESGGETVRVSLPERLARYVVEKGSVAVDGVSLTVVELARSSFTVSLIPVTVERTTLGSLRPGEPVNLEVDVVAKYVERCVETYLRSRVESPRPGGPS